jgi:hypothetical protein
MGLSSRPSMWPEALRYLWGSIPLSTKNVVLGTLLATLSGLFVWVMNKMFFHRPKLCGEFLGKLVTSRLGQADSELFVAEIMFRVRIVNRRNFPTTIQNWSVMAVHEDKQFPSQVFSPESERFAGRPLPANLKMLEPYCVANRLEYGTTIEGGLFFKFSGIGRDVQKHTKVVLTVKDSSGNTHKIATGNLDDIPTE